MLSANVTKESVTTNQVGLYIITLKLVLTDSEGAGFTKTYSEEYRTGENIDDKKIKFLRKMQHDIDSYKSSQTISNTVALATAVTEIQNGLSL